VSKGPNKDGTIGVDEILLKAISPWVLVNARQQHPFKRGYSKFQPRQIKQSGVLP